METILPESAGLKGVRRIDEGGSGIVYAACHPALGEIAVKVAVDLDPDTKQLFLSEYSLLRSLHHPGVIKLWDLGFLDDGRPFIIMELLSEGNLYSLVDRLPIGGRFRPLGKVASALEYLHHLGIVHRDLKGENILCGKDHNLRITDLGLAAGTNDNRTARGGTVEYMAPEVIDNQGASIASDIYSLGVILYRVATRKLPFTSDDPLQIISQKRKPEELDFDEVATAVSPRFAETIRKCLDPDPANRLKSVAEVSEQLLIDKLFQRDDTDPQRLYYYFHHHIWSYSTSFARQEISRFDRDYVIDDHSQATDANLFEVVRDHLKANGCVVECSDQQSAVSYLNDTGAKHFVKRGKVAPATSQPGEIVDYPELDRFAFDAILRKLFPDGITPGVNDLLFRFSSGNIRLLRLLLTQLENESAVDMRKKRITLSPQRLFHFSPMDHYCDAVAEMITHMPHELQQAAAFLSIDRFDNSRGELIKRGKVADEDLKRLAQLDLLNSENYQFRRTYMREYFYRKIDEAVRRRLHDTWADLIEDLEVENEVLRNEQLFYHFTGAGRTEKAITVAIRLADQLRQEQKPDRAISFLALARVLPNAASNLSLHIKLLIKSAELANDAGELNRALSDCAAAIKFAARCQDTRSLADAYRKLGDIYKGKRDYRRGNRALDRAVKLYGELGDELELSHCLNNIGNLYGMTGDLESAEFNYLTALEVQRRLGIKRDIASTLSNLGSVKCMRQDLEAGIELLKESVLIKREIGDVVELARTANNLAIAYYETDELHLANEYLTESWQVNLSQGAEKELLYNYENFYEIEWRRGNYQKAEDWLYAGLKLARQDDYSHRGNFAVLLANLKMMRGKYGKAGNLLAAARRYEQQVTDGFLTLNLLSTQAEYCRLLFDLERAWSYSNAAFEQARGMGEKKKQAQLLILQSRIRRIMGGDINEVNQRLDRAAELLSPLSARREKLTLLLDKLDYYLSLGKLDNARMVLVEAQGSRQFEGINTFEARLNYLHGRLESQSGNLTRTITLLHDAIVAARTMQHLEIAWRALVELGDSYHSKREYEKSLRSYLEAFAILKELAAGIADPILKKKYLSDQEKISVAEKLEEMTALAT